MKIQNLTLLKIKTFVKSLIFHIYSGFPKSPKDEIEKRWLICNACEHFCKKESICNICGCSLSNKKEFLNKLAWADQECPVGKWKKYQ
jgi:uncharacterized paraquat-inducible protein A